MKRVLGQTLVATLIVIAIIAVLTVVLLKGSGAFAGAGANQSPRADGKGTTTVGLAQLRAKDEVCRSNLGQVRMAIQVYRTTADDTPPGNLQECKLPAEFYACPLGKEPYKYDPGSGTVTCVHPGHEKF